MIEVCLTNSNIFSKKCVNVNGSPLYKASKYLLAEITTSITIYADDVQLLFNGSPNNHEQLKIYAETSLKTMKEWYSENGLKMNSNKTQCILFATPKFNKRTETFQITIDDTERHMFL